MTGPSVGARRGRAAWIPRPTPLTLLEFGAPFVVAVLILPTVIAHGTFRPWAPQTTDLQVYVYAVHDMLAGKDIYATRTPGWNLPFIYPPIAAVLMVPLVVGPYLMWQLIWTAGLIVAQNSVLKRCGIRRGWPMVLVSVACVLLVEPLRTTLGYGQINTFLMAFVLIDLLPDRPGSRRIGPRGWLIGLAAALKLTPGLFIVFLLFLGPARGGRAGWRTFRNAVASFVVFTGIGAIVQFRATLHFYAGASHGDIGTPAPYHYVGNQSLTGMVARLGAGDGAVQIGAGLALSAAVAVLAVIMAVHWWRAGERLFAAGLVGLASCLASPYSWTHHYVWIVPFGIACLTSRRLPRWSRIVGGVWAGWVAWCPMLMVLPYGGDAELHYNLGQQLVGDLGPLLGALLVAGLTANFALSRLAPPSPAGVTEVP